MTQEKKYICDADCPDVDYGICCHPNNCKKRLRLMTQEKKQTAVEWFVNELVKKGFPIEKHGIDSYQQALAMEKEQIYNAQIDAIQMSEAQDGCFDFNKYYNENYGKEKN